jgi:hypothetical protein
LHETGCIGSEKNLKMGRISHLGVGRKRGEGSVEATKGEGRGRERGLIALNGRLLGL